MALPIAALSSVDAELDALAEGVDVARLSSRLRTTALAAAAGDVDAALASLGTDAPLPFQASKSPVAPPRASVPVERAPASVAPPRPSVPVPAAVVEATMEPEIPLADDDDDDDDDEIVVEAARGLDAPSARVARPVDVVAVEELPSELPDDSAESLLNPFEDPDETAAGFDDDEQTMILDASEFGGLDMDALFDGMVENALSAPIDDAGLSAQARARRPSTDPPPDARHRGDGETDIEQLRPDGDDDDLELFVEDDAIGVAMDDDSALEGLEGLEAPSPGSIDAEGDPDGDGPKKKGFFKKLFG